MLNSKLYPIKWELKKDSITNLSNNHTYIDYSDSTLKIENWEVEIVYMENWEQKIIPIENFLWLSSQEKRILSNYKERWYILIWEKRWQEYPDYIKIFMQNHPNSLIDWDEIEEKRYTRYWNKDFFSEELQQLVFIKSSNAINNTFDDNNRLELRDIDENIMKVKFWLEKILTKK